MRPVWVFQEIFLAKSGLCVYEGHGEPKRNPGVPLTGPKPGRGAETKQPPGKRTGTHPGCLDRGTPAGR